MSCGVGRRCGLDPTLLWLWCSLATAALIQPLTWELPYATPAALKSKKKKKKNPGVPFVAQQLANPPRIHEDVGSIPALTQWVKDPALP